VRIGIIGGGPSGLYFAALMKRSDPGHEITLLERNPADATFGWGVVFSEETLGAFRDADFETYTEITDTFARWGAIDVRYRGDAVRSRGHVFSAIARKRLLHILQQRCSSLGVELVFEHEFGGLSELDAFDLVVGADGVRSTIRRELASAFLPSEDVHSTRFIWFGTDLVFDAFTFIFRENEHGLFQVHGYPFDAETSTFIVECPEETWRRAGLDAATEGETIAYCEALFSEELAGHHLLSNRSTWINFVTLRCESWHADNVVLMGDAAHTAHFTIGSGTKLAMEDAIALAEAFQRHPDMEKALLEYEMERQPVVERFQDAARESATYFENVRRYAAFDPLQFSFNLLTRSGRITHLELEKRDPSFVRRVDGRFASATADAAARDRLVAPPPLFAPLRLGGVSVTNRVTLSPVAQDDAVDGVPGTGHAERLVAAAEAGAGLVLTDFVAVSAQGRITPGTAGAYADAHADAWSDIVARIHTGSEARAGLQIGHAGARAATRPRREGVDRPLADGGWPLIAASESRYTKLAQTTAAVDGERLPAVVSEFVAAARRAAASGFDLLEINMAQGYLLGGFLSPLTNRRTDRYGGSPEGRATFPLEVFDAVRSAWPDDRPLAVALLASDWARGGFDVDDAVAVARMLRDRGCNLIRPLAGATTIRDAPVYGRFFLVPFSDRIRNEAGLPTLVGGNLTTNDEINTILAGGRADLCLIDPRS
jgi:anthraniloyl-CoA monooxygenase